MNFSSIPGLSILKSKLIKAVQDNHIGHAQLFAGRVGALNLPLALAYATYLHCQNKGLSDSCGQCAACVKSHKYVHPDTSFVFPLNNMKADKDEEHFKSDILKTWRSFLIQQPYGDLDDWISQYGGEDKQALISKEESKDIIKRIALKPFESTCKVMIIWQPELMHIAAANGILKIVEEPPTNTYFLLVTNDYEKLLSTILSRTQMVQVPLLSDEEMNDFLDAKGISEKQKHEIISLADGQLNKAIKLLNSEQSQYHDTLTDWMRTNFKKDYRKMVELADWFHDLDKLAQQHFIQYTLNIVREAMLYFAGAESVSRLQETERKFTQDFSKLLDVLKIEKMNQILSQASYHLERNGSAKMIFLDASLQMAKLWVK